MKRKINKNNKNKLDNNKDKDRNVVIAAPVEDNTTYYCKYCSLQMVKYPIIRMEDLICI
jgi:hypothetical protein